MHKIIIPKNPATKGSPFSLKEKIMALGRVKLGREDPHDVLGPIYESYGLPVPKYPAQGLSSFAKQVEHLVAAGDQVAIRLARESGFEVKEIDEPVD